MQPVEAVQTSKKTAQDSQTLLMAPWIEALDKGGRLWCNTGRQTRQARTRHPAGTRRVL